jgi:phosphoglycerate dehydrogenase-like enzyme
MADLLRESDIVSLHVPLTQQTEKLIGAAELAMMKPGAILLNLARGEVVDEAALADALDSGRLSGAGIDVFSEEPLNPANPLLSAPNVMLSPHIAGTTDESRWRMIEMTLANIQRVLNGEKPRNVINGVE